MPVSEDGCMKKMKHVTYFGKLKILSENTVVTDGPPVYLFQFNFELLWKIILFIKLTLHTMAQHTYHDGNKTQYLRNRTKLRHSKSTKVPDQKQSFNQNEVYNRLLDGHALISGK